MAKLLVIDDDKHTCEYIRKFFVNRKCDVSIANSGTEGLEMFKKEKPDITFLDIKMPDMGGPDVLKRIKQQAPQAKVVMITIASSDENRQKALELGADDFIKKPFDIEYLEGTVSLKVAMLTKERKQS